MEGKLHCSDLPTSPLPTSHPRNCQTPGTVQNPSLRSVVLHMATATVLRCSTFRHTCHRSATVVSAAPIGSPFISQTDLPTPGVFPELLHWPYGSGDLLSPTVREIMKSDQTRVMREENEFTEGLVRRCHAELLGHEGHLNHKVSKLMEADPHKVIGVSSIEGFDTIKVSKDTAMLITAHSTMGTKVLQISIVKDMTNSLSLQSL
ncbi:hypothetical protein ZIOFF_054021 [Zingiber officinale]|uniref:Uncharacterized protein n=1 Tax=Zingiber officinale TaxID=94328 RepID=A0A8J5FGY2_ZINOF|nr:hypothetical protein ZIOFF_054021 [Zingiber officinale]